MFACIPHCLESISRPWAPPLPPCLLRQSCPLPTPPSPQQLALRAGVGGGGLGRTDWLLALQIERLPCFLLAARESHKPPGWGRCIFLYSRLIRFVRLKRLLSGPSGPLCEPPRGQSDPLILATTRNEPQILQNMWAYSKMRLQGSRASLRPHDEPIRQSLQGPRASLQGY
jgi:hypothetical protein